MVAEGEEDVDWPDGDVDELGLDDGEGDGC